MRFTSISSSIASVLSRVIGFEAAGIAVRTFLHHTYLRGHMLVDLGSWLKPYQSQCTANGDYTRLLQASNAMPGKPTGIQRLLGRQAFAVCPAPSAPATAAALASVRARELG